MYAEHAKTICILLAFGFVVAIIGKYIYRNKDGEKLMEQLKNYLATDAFKDSVHEVMIYAEHLITGTKKGQERLLYVCGWINAHLPSFLQPVVTQEILVDIVNDLFKLYAEKTDKGTVVK